MGRRRAGRGQEAGVRNATAVGLVVLLAVIVGAAAFQLLIALG